MKMRELFLTGAAAIGIAASCGTMLVGTSFSANAEQAAEPAIDEDDIGGVVTGPNGPEAGVWVIAESVELPTKFARIVVTDDQGRYVIPDLPAVNYSVWVRGYGLVDSPRMRAKPGQHRDLAAVPAPTEAAAAHYYPAIYWYSMLKVPPASEIGNDQVGWFKQMKNIGCIGCHQIGQEATRTIPAQFGTIASGEEAWARRLQSGQAGEEMIKEAQSFNGGPLKYLGEWTDRIAGGELPKSDRRASSAISSLPLGNGALRAPICMT